MYRGSEIYKTHIYNTRDSDKFHFYDNSQTELITLVGRRNSKKISQTSKQEKKPIDMYLLVNLRYIFYRIFRVSAIVVCLPRAAATYWNERVSVFASGLIGPFKFFFKKTLNEIYHL